MNSNDENEDARKSADEKFEEFDTEMDELIKLWDHFKMKDTLRMGDDFYSLTLFGFYL